MAASMNSETDFRRHVIEVAEGIGAHVSHIESHESSAGIPDLNLYLTGADLWIELKVIKQGSVKMRPTQKRWHLDRYEHGGASWVLVLDMKTGDILTVPGEVAATLGPRESVWRGAGAASNINKLSQLLVSLARRMKNGYHQPEPDRNRTPQGTRIPAPALPTGGEDVGGHHWLLNKA